MNELYEIFNRQYIEEQIQREQNHYDQINEIQKSVRALKDFLESSSKIQPTYRQNAFLQYCNVLNLFLNNSQY